MRADHGLNAIRMENMILIARKLDNFVSIFEFTYANGAISALVEKKRLETSFVILEVLLRFLLLLLLIIIIVSHSVSVQVSKILRFLVKFGAQNVVLQLIT